MSLSLIIPTYNGAHKVVNALDSILEQSRQPDQVVLVIDGSTDNTLEVVERYKKLINNFLIVQQANLGRAVVRNTGAQHASGNILFFLDDDMIMPPNCVEAHFQHHQKYPGTLVSGRLDQKLSNEQKTEFDVFEDWQNSGWNKNLIPATQDEILLQQAYVTANNFSISKEDFFKLGLFDPRLKDAEDYDLAVRAQQSKMSIYLSNQCWAWHNDFSAKNFNSYLKRMRQYNVAQRELIRLKPELHGNPETNPRFPRLPGGFKALVFKFFVSKFFVKSLDNGFWKFLPVSLRCKIYDVIITANGTYYPRVVL